MKRILMSTVTLGLVAGAFGCVNLDEKLITGVSSEYYSTPVLWPDFGQTEFAAALQSYAQRQRKFGGIQA